MTALPFTTPTSAFPGPMNDPSRYVSDPSRDCEGAGSPSASSSPSASLRLTDGQKRTRLLTRAARFGPRRRGLTLAELMVSTALLAAAIGTVAGIFSMSSKAAGLTAAHAEVLEASAALHNTLSDDLSKIVPGLLIIESPPPTLARAEVPGGQRLFRLRHDRLVFLASGGADAAFQSFTDPTRGTPGPTDADTRRGPATSPDALVCFAPGIPLDGDGTDVGARRPFDDESIALAASEWVFAHRAILLLLDDPGAAGWSPPDMRVLDSAGVSGMLNGDFLIPDVVEGKMDAIISFFNVADPFGSIAASASSVIDLLAGKPVSSFIGATPNVAALWEPNLCPVTFSLSDTNWADHYSRTGFTFLPRLADFAIEWTDGGLVDPLGLDNLPDTGDEDLRTRWFGLAPDITDAPDISAPDDLKYQARLRGVPDPANPSNPNVVDNPDNDPAETDAFLNRIEWSDTGVTPDVDARYRAVWRGADYEQYRPKALRFRYRLFDSNKRLTEPTTLDLNDDGVPDIDMASDPYNVVRYGQEFSIVVALP